MKETNSLTAAGNQRKKPEDTYRMLALLAVSLLQKGERAYA